MQARITEGTLYIKLEGRIDALNAGKVEKEIFEVCEKFAWENIVLDAENLEYISSAGLRIILRLRKKNAGLEIINVSSQVYEILDMTGFTMMMTVNKGYRRFSVEGCEVIGGGAKGKVYRLDPETIIKVYMNPDSLEEIHKERELARTAFVLGVPTAISYDVVKVGNGYGSVFELLNASSLSEIMRDDPSRFDECVQHSVELLKILHRTHVDRETMPGMKGKVLDWAGIVGEYLPEESAWKLKELVEGIPDSDILLHGDYQINNIMFQNGEALLIDMDTLCYGNPIFELAFMFCAYVGFGETNSEETMKFFGLPQDLCREFWEKSIAMYLDTGSPEEIEAVTDKVRVVGYIRLMKRLVLHDLLGTEEGSKAFAWYKEELLELLGKVKDLGF